MYEEYIEKLIKVLREKCSNESPKKTKAFYQYLDSIVEIFETYKNEINTLNQEGYQFDISSKKDIIKILFLDSCDKFDEIVTGIVTNKYSSANCLLRIVIENYAIIKYIINSQKDVAEDFGKWYFVIKYKEIENNKLNKRKIEKILETRKIKDNKALEEEDTKLINDYFESKKQYEIFQDKIKAALEKSYYENQKDFIKNYDKSIEKALKKFMEKNNYGWLLTKFHRYPSFSALAENVKLKDIKDIFDELCSSVHSNDLYEKFNKNRYPFGVESQIVAHYGYMLFSYFELYFKFYKIENKASIYIKKQEVEEKFEKEFSEHFFAFECNEKE